MKIRLLFASTVRSLSSNGLHQQPEASNKRLLKVAIVGAPNAGKSTLLNRLVNSDISSVSKKVHTTRKNILGVYTDENTQLEFYDSPGLITRQHLSKHRLETSLLNDPDDAVLKCDLVGVVVDASNIREKKRLNKGILRILHENSNKKSILILNKVDLIKEKRLLLDISTRLSQGCIDGRSAFKPRDIKRLTYEKISQLNLTDHINKKTEVQSGKVKMKLHDCVIELDSQNYKEKEIFSEDPDMIGYKKFSHIFAISALKDDGVEGLRNYLMSIAESVDTWPHGPDYLTNLSIKDLIHETIRGRVLDYVDHEVPYLVKYKYSDCSYDEYGSLHVSLTIKCPKNYMAAKVIGENGVNIARVIEDSRDQISKTLACDVKLNIQVEIPPGHIPRSLNTR